jgi:hypothetical protein
MGGLPMTRVKSFNRAPYAPRQRRANRARVHAELRAANLDDLSSLELGKNPSNRKN